MGTHPSPQHDEVDILGLDGHVYKGRMETRLPDLLNKDSECPDDPDALRLLAWVPQSLSSSWRPQHYLGPPDPDCLPPPPP